MFLLEKRENVWTQKADNVQLEYLWKHKVPVNMDNVFRDPLMKFINYTHGINASNITNFNNDSQTLNISMLRHIWYDHFFDTTIEIEVIILAAIYVPIFLLGILGNGLILWIICSHPQLRNITNLFLWNVALTDIAGKSPLGTHSWFKQKLIW